MAWRIAGVVCLLSALVGAGTARGALIDALATPDGLQGGGLWAASPSGEGYRIAWEVSQNPDLTWHYSYTTTDEAGNPLTPGTSHIILQLSENIEETDLFNFTGDIEDIEFGTFGPHPSNPGFPTGESIQGVKFDFTDDGTTVAFDSNRQPQWSDFYGKGGSSSFAHNVDLGVEVANPSDYTGTPVDAGGGALSKILAPDTIIPEPATLALIGLGALWTVGRRRV